MTRITPSAVVQYIDSIYPELRNGSMGDCDRSHQQGLATLVALADAISVEVLAGLTAQHHQDLLVAVEYLRVTTNRWNYPPNPSGSNLSVSPFVALGNRHPVAVIREVMEACPEEPVAAARTQLLFLCDPDLEQSIATDVASAEGAFADGRYKNACVMAGSAIEALLLWAVGRCKPPDLDAAIKSVEESSSASGRPLRFRDHDPCQWGLAQYIAVARQLTVLSSTAADSAMLAKDFRNLIHPGKAERTGTQASKGSAAQAIAGMMLTIEELAARRVEGQQ